MKTLLLQWRQDGFNYFMVIASFIDVPVQTPLKSENTLFHLNLLLLFGINFENKGCRSIKYGRRKERVMGSVRSQNFRLHCVEGSLLTFLL